MLLLQTYIIGIRVIRRCDVGMATRVALGVGDTILHGKYKVLKVMHVSGMANVYLVSDTNLGKEWCLKEIHKSAAGKNMIEYYALIQEANIMKGLNHASIPRIVTIEDEGDSTFIVMDYVDGVSIKAWLVKKGKINQDVVVTWMKQICQVMMYLHNRKHPIFYRDMKPDNVMIQRDGNIKLLDFGISVVLKEKGQKIDKALGTKGYAAPEQSKKGNICDLRSDIYAMGKTMYYMLTGINPSQIPKEKLKSVRELDSSISIGLNSIVEKCVKDNPDERYQTCEELLYDLQNYKTLDVKYRSGLKRKIVLSCGMFAFSVVLIASSFIPLAMYRVQRSKEYERLLTVAEQSMREEDYKRVLEIDATSIRPYLGYIDSIKVDGVFSEKEEESILNYLNPNLDEIKQKEGYGELAFNIGKLYWFYYKDDGVVSSVRWFEDAQKAGYEKDLSKVYYNLGSFRKDISSLAMESSDNGKYLEYWNNLLSVKGMDSGELVGLQLNCSIANCISTYCYNLKQDGLAYKDIIDQVSDLELFVNTYQPTIETATEDFEQLKLTVSTLREKVDTIYQDKQDEEEVG